MLVRDPTIDRPSSVSDIEFAPGASLPERLRARRPQSPQVRARGHQQRAVRRRSGREQRSDGRQRARQLGPRRAVRITTIGSDSEPTLVVTAAGAIAVFKRGDGLGTQSPAAATGRRPPHPRHPSGDATPVAVLDGAGRLDIAFQQAISRASGIYFAHGSGGVWSAPRRLSTSAGDMLPTIVVTGKTPRIEIAFQRTLPRPRDILGHLYTRRFHPRRPDPRQQRARRRPSSRRHPFRLRARIRPRRTQTRHLCHDVRQAEVGGREPAHREPRRHPADARHRPRRGQPHRLPAHRRPRRARPVRAAKRWPHVVDPLRHRHDGVRPAGLVVAQRLDPATRLRAADNRDSRHLLRPDGSPRSVAVHATTLKQQPQRRHPVVARHRRRQHRPHLRTQMSTTADGRRSFSRGITGGHHDRPSRPRSRLRSSDRQHSATVHDRHPAHSRWHAYRPFLRLSEDFSRRLRWSRCRNRSRERAS